MSNIPTQAPSFMNTKQMAQLFEVTPMTVLRWLKADKIPKPAMSINGGFVWNRHDIEDFIVEGDGLELVDTSGKGQLPDPGDDPVMQQLVADANEISDETERLMAKSEQFQRQLKLQLMTRENAIQKNQEIHADGEQWKLKGNRSDEDE